MIIILAIVCFIVFMGALSLLTYFAHMMADNPSKDINSDESV